MTHISIVPNDVWRVIDTGERSNVQSSPSAPETRCMQLLRLPHPRTGVPSLFLPSTAASADRPSSCILEVQAVAPHSSRSWFLEGNQIVADGKLLMMTPIDPVFLLIPILQAAQPVDGTIGNFRPSDDIFEEAALRLSQSKSSVIKSQEVLQLAALDCVRDALKRMCDYKEITEELSVYRLSHAKLLQTLAAKVTRISQPDVFDAYPTLQRQLARDGLMDEGKDDLRQAGRTRAACEVISQYLPPDITSELIALNDFAALNRHLQALADEAIVLTPARSVAAPKENGNDKKRKATSQLSKGVSKLMKVNTSGMTKISSFFKKPAK